MLKEATLQTARLLNVLPDDDIAIIHHLVKNFVRAWDPNFTKLTNDEKIQLEKSEAEMKSGNFVSDEEMWV